MHVNEITPLYTAGCVIEAAAALQAHSTEVATFLSIEENRPLTEAELSQLHDIYDRMNTIECQLIRRLNLLDLEIN